MAGTSEQETIEIQDDDDIAEKKEKAPETEGDGVKHESSSDETPGPSRALNKPEIVEILDDSNSSTPFDCPILKPVVTEPDDLPPEGSISASSSKASPEIIEITDPTGNDFQVEFVESLEEVAKESNKSTETGHLEEIPEEVENADNPLEDDKLPKIEEPDPFSVVENQKVTEPAQTSPNTIEKEIAALETSTEERTSDVVDDALAQTKKLSEEPPVNGVDDALTEKSAEASSSGPHVTVSEIQETSNKEEKPVKIPPHLIGRNLGKPNDSVKNGRVTVKPRLGVKVPYRNLTSQIVSKQDITNEIMERSRQRQATAEPTGNVLFAQKLTNRLARKLSPTNKMSKPLTDVTAAVVSTASKAPLLPSTDRIANNSDLIALLEGDDDTDWNLISTKKSPVKNADWERETALKQLQELPKLGRKEVDDEPRFSLNPVTKTYTRKRKPSEDIKAILETAKKLALTPHSAKSTPGTPAKTSDQAPTSGKLGTPHKPFSANTPKTTPFQKAREMPQKVGQTPQKTVSKTLVTSKIKDTELKQDAKTPNVLKQQADVKKSSISVQKLKPTEQKGTPNSAQKSVAGLKGVTEVAERKPVLGQKQLFTGQKASSPKTPPKLSKTLSIQKSIQNIRNLSAQSPSSALPPHVKLSTDKKAIIILSTSSPESAVKKKRIVESDQSDTETKTPIKKPLSPNTYISKSSRVVKRKKIWDPDEATPTKMIKSPQSNLSERKSIVEKIATLVEKQTAKKIIKKAIAKKKKPKRTEIDRLLMDEGAVNLLYSVKNTGNAKKRNKSVISLDKAERELLHRTNEIKNDLLQNNVKKDSPVGLRKKVAVKSTFKDPAAVILQRKKSKDSVEGSLHVNTPPASPAYAYHENVSRIIRRHSSSSFTSKESEDDSTDEKSGPPKKKKAEKVRKNSNVAVENNEIVIDDSKYAAFETLNVRKFENLVQIILVPTSPNALITLTIKVLEELTDILALLQLDSECRVVVVSSAGNSFCMGIDYKELAASNAKERKTVAQQHATAISAFLLALSKFSKLIVAGVHGNAIGLGVTMLPLFDMVLASDTATFSTPYTRLGCAAEGGVLLKLPHVMHNALASELFFASRKLTAAEALRLGLVTRTLWPDKFQEELISALKLISGQSLQSMEAIKKQLRHQLLMNVEPALKSESKILIQHWISNECQNNFVNYSMESK